MAAIPGIWVMGKREKIDVVARAALQRGRRQTAHFNSGRLRWLHVPATKKPLDNKDLESDLNSRVLCVAFHVNAMSTF